jgi:hypothetical protein
MQIHYRQKKISFLSQNVLEIFVFRNDSRVKSVVYALTKIALVGFSF